MMRVESLPCGTEARPAHAYWLGFGLALLSVLALFKVGVPAVLGWGGLLGSLLLTPLLVNRYKLVLALWLFVCPAFDNWRALLVAGANPIIILITGLTIPVALVLMARHGRQVLQTLPFAGCLVLFNLILMLNLLRPDAETGGVLECLKVFIELFIICCGFIVIRSGHVQGLFRGINLFIILNCVVAFLQRITGIGMMRVEGIPRVGGLVGHPNCLAFVIVLYIPFAMYWVMHAENKRDRNFWLAGVMLGVAALLLTMCKNAIFTFGFELLVLGCFLPTNLKLRLLISGLVCAALLVVADLVFQLELLNHFTDRLNSNASWVWRMRIWGYLLSAMDVPSTIWGHGTNAASALLRVVAPRGSDHVHNVYLQILFDYGLTGLALIGAFLFPLLHFAGRFFRAGRSGRFDQVMPLLILSAIFINMSSDNSIFLRTPMTFAWLFISYFYLQSKRPSVSLTEEKPRQSFVRHKPKALAAPSKRLRARQNGLTG